jgi:hypothetical protein
MWCKHAAANLLSAHCTRCQYKPCIPMCDFLPCISFICRKRYPVCGHAVLHNREPHMHTFAPPVFLASFFCMTCSALHFVIASSIRRLSSTTTCAILLLRISSLCRRCSSRRAMHESHRVVALGLAVGWASVHIANSIFGFFFLQFLQVQLPERKHSVQRPDVELGLAACSHSPGVNSSFVFKA